MHDAERRCHTWDSKDTSPGANHTRNSTSPSCTHQRPHNSHNAHDKSNNSQKDYQESPDKGCCIQRVAQHRHSCNNTENTHKQQPAPMDTSIGEEDLNNRENAPNEPVEP